MKKVKENEGLILTGLNHLLANNFLYEDRDLEDGELRGMIVAQMKGVLDIFKANRDGYILEERIERIEKWLEKHDK